jgi:hypothetical protein
MVGHGRSTEGREAMLGPLQPLFSLRGEQSLRVTVAWKKRRVRRVKFEYGRPRLLRRLRDALR